MGVLEELESVRDRLSAVNQERSELIGDRALLITRARNEGASNDEIAKAASVLPSHTYRAQQRKWSTSAKKEKVQ